MPDPRARNAEDIGRARAFLDAMREPFEQRLAAWLDRKARRAAAAHPEARVLVDALRELATRGGKRIRPALVLTGYSTAAPGADLSPAFEAALSVELLHTFLLIQDDWMDRDTTRRGGPTAHVILSGRYSDEHKGASAALLAGDLGCSFAWEALAASALPHDRIRAALDVLGEMLEDVVYGQLLDVLGQGPVETIHLLKTAGYTVRGPLRMGALLGGATPETLQALERYARPVGLAFQLRDDLLGTFGDPSATGKASGNDLREGKRTALIERAEAMIDDAERRAVLTRVLGKRDASELEIAEAKAVLERGGVRAKIEEEIEEHLLAALSGLEGATIDAEAKSLLSGLAQMVAHRSG